MNITKKYQENHKKSGKMEVVLLCYVAPEQIKIAKEMDLLTYLQNYDPNELIRETKNQYCTREHDSLKISNRFLALGIEGNWWKMCDGLFRKSKGDSFSKIGTNYIR